MNGRTCSEHGPPAMVPPSTQGADSPTWRPGFCETPGCPEGVPYTCVQVYMIFVRYKNVEQRKVGTAVYTYYMVCICMCKHIYIYTYVYIFIYEIYMYYTYIHPDPGPNIHSRHGPVLGSRGEHGATVASRNHSRARWCPKPFVAVIRMETCLLRWVSSLESWS